jgi:hypothetical protein
MKEKKWRTYILLNEPSRNDLKKLSNGRNKLDWELHAEHYTVTYNQRYEELGIDIALGTEICIMATHIGENDHCCAVKTEGFYTHHPIPHITILVNHLKGSTPVMSNTITEWTELETPIKLTGLLVEFEK